MALPSRPDVIVKDDRTTHCSLDTADQGLFNGLKTPNHRRKFCEMIHRWRDEIQMSCMSIPFNGHTIAARWKSSGCKLKPRRMRPIAAQAMPPQLVATGPPAAMQVVPPVAAPTVISPLQSPLAELSPRFMCQADENVDILMSPTKGQVDFIADNLNGPWRFADVISQKEVTEDSGKFTLAPMTSICLFVRPSVDGRIEEQMAVKCQEVNELANDLKDSTLATANAAVKRELNIHQLVGSTQCSHVIKYRGHSVRKKDTHVIKPDSQEVETYSRKTVHLYQDFADCGNLEHLIDRHRVAAKPIQEHFIWYTLRELTEALIALKRGPGHCSKPHPPAAELPASDEYRPIPIKPWISTLHLDIKTDNVFLKTNNTDYPGYPKPVLADFGISCQANDGVTDLEKSIRSGAEQHQPRFAGTSGWHPPERHDGALDIDDEGFRLDPAYEPYEWQLSEKSDIWALGLIAHKMMYSHRTDTVESKSEGEISVADSTLSKEGTWKNTLLKDEISKQGSHFDICEAEISHLPELYSVRLCALTSRCLRHDIEGRPDLDKLLLTCQEELTRLDTLSESTADKRKREDNAEKTTLLIGDDAWDRKFNKYRVGETYQPRRRRTKIDISDDYREVYTQLVNAWSSMRRPTPASQDTVIGAIVSYLVGYDEKPEEYNWAVKHLVSCLRKRNNPVEGAHILTATYTEEHGAHVWIENVFEPETKTRVLEDLLGLEALWEGQHVGYEEDEGVDVALETFKNAVEWGLIMLRDTMTPLEVNDEKTAVGGLEPAEPREPRMEDQSALHWGVYDWIFVRPTGAFYKN
ncbi:G2-specific protein kinase nim-1 [Stagonosporopsis vannaccii]|nr:G2-specific protein kinase nim-1 [Stagonosporopsis vannaccii]